MLKINPKNVIRNCIFQAINPIIGMNVIVKHVISIYYLVHVTLFANCFPPYEFIYRITASRRLFATAEYTQFPGLFRTRTAAELQYMNSMITSYEYISQQHTRKYSWSTVIQFT